MPGPFMGAHSTFPQPSVKTPKPSSSETANTTTDTTPSSSNAMSSSGTEKLNSFKAKLGFHSKSNMSYSSLASTLNEKGPVDSGTSAPATTTGLTEAQTAKLNKYRAVNDSFKESPKRTGFSAFGAKPSLR